MWCGMMIILYAPRGVITGLDSGRRGVSAYQMGVSVYRYGVSGY